MQEFFSIQGLTTLVMLVLLQAVLGFDNLLYISIESKRAPEDQQSWVRRVGIVLAIGLRIVLLLVIMLLIDKVKEPLFKLAIPNPFASEMAAESDPAPAPEPLSPVGAEGPVTSAGKAAHDEHGGDRPGGSSYIFFGDFTLHSLITLFGGAFILYTAVKEVLHLLAVEHIEHGAEGQPTKPVGMVVTMIVIMNLVFSFDSILSAMALTSHFSRGPAFWLMAVAVVASGVLMIYLADTVSEFLKKNRMYEVLGLFVLFIVGVMLLGEGGHLAHLTLFSYHVEPMAKSTFYFTLAVLLAIDIVQAKYRKKLLAQRAHELQDDHVQAGEPADGAHGPYCLAPASGVRTPPLRNPVASWR